MKTNETKKVECLNSNFEKRLFNLVNVFYRYLRTGNYGGIFPALFSCIVCCWCSKPVVKRVFIKDDFIVIHSSTLRYVKYELKNGLTFEKFYTKDIFDGFDDFVSKHSENESN